MWRGASQARRPCEEDHGGAVGGTNGEGTCLGPQPSGKSYLGLPEPPGLRLCGSRGTGWNPEPSGQLSLLPRQTHSLVAESPRPSVLAAPQTQAQTLPGFSTGTRPALWPPQPRPVGGTLHRQVLPCSES